MEYGGLYTRNMEYTIYCVKKIMVSFENVSVICKFEKSRVALHLPVPDFFLLNALVLRCFVSFQA
jgi:hypothetical protein